ncbi:MAG: GDSL-type esterase/lipase family protein [Mangrovibacterium sp.]
MGKRFAIFLFVLFCLIDQVSAQSNDELYPTDSIVSRYHNSWAIQNYRNRIKSFKKDPLNANEIVFIGNSITQQGGDWSEKFGIEHIRNRGIAGDLTDGVLKRLDEIVYYQPKAVFILIGVNDVFNMYHEKDTRFTYDQIVPSPKYIADNIVKIAEMIVHNSPQTKVFVRTILPIRKDYGNDEIVEVNRLLKACDEKSNFILVDLYNQFVDEEGKLRIEFTKDGTHLNDAGYAHWVKFERKIMKKQLNIKKGNEKNTISI